MTLDKVKRGQVFKILAIPSDSIRAQAIRFGIAEGEIVSCAEIIPAGPVVLKKNMQEIAMGRGIAKTINVQLIS